MIALGLAIAAVSLAAGAFGALSRRRTPADAVVIFAGSLTTAIWNGCYGFYRVGPVDYRWSALYLSAITGCVALWTIMAYRTTKPGWWPPRVVGFLLVAQPVLILGSTLLGRETWGRLFWAEGPWLHEPSGIAYGVVALSCVVVIAAGAAPLLARFNEIDGFDRFLVGGSVLAVAAGVGSQLVDASFMPYAGFVSLLLMIALAVRTNPYDPWALARLAEVDAVTGAISRRGLERVLHQAIAQATAETPVALMLIDVDRFKSINDTHGHLVGDEVLRQVATRSREVTRGVVGRFGGDEIVVVLPGIDDGGAMELARQIVGASGFVVCSSEAPDPVTVSVTVSVGVAVLPCASSAELLAAADRAMYTVKRRGGNGAAGTEASSQVPAGSTESQS